MGIAFIKSEQFDKAAARLEEVWEQDQSDLSVGEFLAVAYLNTEDRQALPDLQKQAFELISSLHSAGAEVSFLLLHSHEKLGWLQGRELNQYCSGRLVIKGRKVTYLSEKGEHAAEHSFEMRASDAKNGHLRIHLNENDRRGTFRIESPKGDYYFGTRNRNRDEAAFIVDLVNGL